MMNRTEKKVEEFIEKYEMVGKDDTVVTGVSGGADSVCLLFMLCSLSRRLGFRVIACHVNHGLRGGAADEDEAYVIRLCERLGVPCRIFRENVESIARKRKQSTEEAGRMIRRNAFETMCRENGGTKIATAHHRDDNAETVLLNIARGTGIRGLCGIRPVRGKWIRPMLCLSRAEIEEWAAEAGIAFCTDATNEEDVYTRNRIRHNILPAMAEQVNAGAVQHLNDLSLQAQEIWDYIKKETDRAQAECVSYGGKEENSAGAGQDAGTGKIVNISEGIRELDPVIAKALVHRCICEAAGEEKDIEAVHVTDTIALFGKQVGKQTDLPYRVRAVRTYAGVTLERAARPGENGVKDAETVLNIPGVTYFPGTGQTIECTILDAGEASFAKEFPQKSYTKCFDYDIIKYSLSARGRRPGDYFTVDGEGGRQKLKSYFINEKVPRQERDRKLLIADGDHIVWIPGMRMSRAYQIGSRTKRILMIKITEDRKYVRDDQSIDPGRGS